MSLPCETCMHQIVCKHKEQFKEEYEQIKSKAEIVIVDARCKYYTSNYKINTPLNNIRGLKEWVGDYPVIKYTPPTSYCEISYIVKEGR